MQGYCSIKRISTHHIAYYLDAAISHDTMLLHKEVSLVLAAGV